MTVGVSRSLAVLGVRSSTSNAIRLTYRTFFIALVCFEAHSICTIHWTVIVFNIPYLIAFSSTATSAGKAAETKTNDILAMISPEGERVGLTKVINIIISFFVNEKTLCCPFYNEVKGRFPRVRTGWPDHGWSRHFDKEIVFFWEFLLKNHLLPYSEYPVITNYLVNSNNIRYSGVMS